VFLFFISFFSLYLFQWDVPSYGCCLVALSYVAAMFLEVLVVLVRGRAGAA